MPDNNVCPICRQTVLGKAMQEHFLEELKAYRQEPLSARDVSSSSPSVSPTMDGRQSRSHGGHSSSSTTNPAVTPRDIDSRHEIFLRVRANRKARHTTPYASAPNDHHSGRRNRRSSASSSSETKSTNLRHRIQPQQQQTPATSSRHSLDPAATGSEMDTDLIVDVENEDDDEEEHDREKRPHSPAESALADMGQSKLPHSAGASRRNSLRQSPAPSETRRKTVSRDGDEAAACGLFALRSDDHDATQLHHLHRWAKIRRRSGSEDHAVAAMS